MYRRLAHPIQVLPWFADTGSWEFCAMATTRLEERADSAGADRLIEKRAESSGAAFDGTRYVARQPILDIRGNLHGYELLFRAGPTAAFSGDGNAATRDVLDNLVALSLIHISEPTR